MAEKLTAAITIKMTDGDVRALQHLANRAGTCPSDFMRSLLTREKDRARADYEALAAIFGQPGASVQENQE